MINPWKAKSKINPQRENGNRQLANEVYQELIRADLSAVDYKLTLHVIDMTWGYNKSSAVIVVSQTMQATGLAERTVRKGMKSLKDRKIVYYQPSKTVHSGAPLNEYLFNKHYDTWLVDKSVDNSQKEGCIVVQGCTGRASRGAQSGQKTVHGCAPLKRNDKENKESVSKLSSNYNIKEILYGLKRHAPKSGIIAILKIVPKNKWYEIRNTLMHSYKDGLKAYNDAVAQLEKEGVKV